MGTRLPHHISVLISMLAVRPSDIPYLLFSQALRLTMVQILINSKGLNMNPLQSLYYVSPACMISLLIPFRE